MFVLRRKLLIGIAFFAVPALAFVLSGCSGEAITKTEQKPVTEQVETGKDLQGVSDKRIESGLKNPGQRGGMGAPVEATAACNGKSEGDSCSVTIAGTPDGSDRTISGTCKKGREEESLFCMSGGNGMGFGRNDGEPRIAQ